MGYAFVNITMRCNAPQRRGILFSRACVRLQLYDSPANENTPKDWKPPVLLGSRKSWNNLVKDC
jgi:hypothetical protein